MRKHMEIAAVSLFCGFLTIMGILYFLLPETEFSEKEKRYLEEKPVFSGERLLSGQWGEDVETYLADHMPGRDFFVGLNAYFEKLTGRQKAGDIWQDGAFLLEAPAVCQEEQLQKNVNAIKKLAEKSEVPVDFMLIPSAGSFHSLPQYQDRPLISRIYGSLKEAAATVDLTDVLDRDSYYRTDHHWTSAGAFRAYEKYAETTGVPVCRDFEKQQFGGFRGSTYSRSGLWLTPGEQVELWRGSDGLTVEIGTEIHDGIFFRENLQKPDMYTVFLGGNHPLVRISNPRQSGKLLVIRDSFSNCLGGFLAESYGEVVMLDLRYYKQSVFELLESEAFDRILVCYSLNHFLSDKNLVFLQK